MTSEENQTENVSVRVDASENETETETEDQGNSREKFELLSLCSEDPPSLADDQENGTAPLNNGNPVRRMRVLNIAQSSDSDASDSEDPSEARGISLLETTRQFYHSRTFQPMTLEEIMSDRDSADEVDDEDTDFQDSHMIDDSEDVGPTEKNFMNLWNSFVRKQRVIADGHVPWACEAFSKFHKKEFIKSEPLYSCWRMFMIELWDYGLIDAITINKCNLIIQDSEDDLDNTTNNNDSVDRGIGLNRNNDVEEDVNDNEDK